MKRLIHVTLTAFLVVGIYSTSFAQNNTDTGTHEATANVLSAVNVASQTILDFGDVQPDVNKTVNADGTGNDNDVAVGEFTVTGSDGATVKLNFTTLDNLTDGSGNTLTIDYASSSYALWSADSDNDAGDQNPFDPDGTQPTATLDSDGIHVFIGGQAQPDASQPGGNYSGTVTLTATYN